MSKPIIYIKLKTLNGKTGKVRAVVDSGSYYTIIHEDKLPYGTPEIRFPKPQVFSTAKKKSKLYITAITELILTIKNHTIMDGVLISPDLNTEFILGAKTMQAWDISIRNKNGKTTIIVGKDMYDPEIQTVV